MLIAERRRRILQEARATGAVSLRDLAERLGTSEPTVRRDLRAMAAEGLLHRTHGGALLPTGVADEPTYSEKAGQAAAEKKAIARLAVGLVQPGESIVLGPGTTTLALARELAGVPDLTVVTNSLLVAMALMNAPDIEVVLTGGTLRRSIHALVGPSTEQTMRGLRVTQAFLSGNGLRADRGLTTPNLLVASADRALAEAARRVVVLADHTKIGSETMCQTVPVDGIGVLVTDSAADAAETARLSDAGVDVRVAQA
ncbi:MAG TPA: DeoR/GlpR family DNA-binding transcription regulator [Mycobacteriales bacterium]|jgi:DeoR/GlpR family transcriptional regulator of sugar metabolism|nr:DeoR/GlpR family DNA-binding transcription regulator [Mycobacteriales bacterium]